MKTILSITFAIFFIHLNAQSVSINLNSEDKTCVESGTIYNGIDNWEVFQTDNNISSGTKTILCAEFQDADSEINISTAEEGKVIFIESIESLDIPITDNNIFSLSTLIMAPEELFCDCSTECTLDVCNEIIVIFKGDINGITLRDTISIMSSEFSNFNGVDRNIFESCFVTPPYDNLVIDKISISVFPQEIDASSYIKVNSLFFSDVEDYNFYFDDATFMNHVIPDAFRLGIAYVVRPTFFTEFQDAFYFGHIKVLNSNLRDPSNNEKFYYEITPEDSTAQKIINIINTNFSQLVFQKDAHLRGALVSLPDNDTLRHRVNLVNDGANMCIAGLVDLIIDNENEFRFKSGSIHFSNDMSCVQIRKKAKLVIDKGAYLHYGNNGIGLLSLRSGAIISIEDNAALYFDGELVMPDNNISKVTVKLNSNQSLKFSPSSKIKTYHPDAKLTIYMEGGHLDISQLRPEYYQYLDIIYPEQLTSNPKSIVLYPNPASEILTLFIEQENIGSTISIYNQIGNRMTNIIYLENRINEIDISALESGIYFVRHNTGDVIRLVVE